MRAFALSLSLGKVIVKNATVASFIFHLSSLIKKNASPDQCERQDGQPKAQVFGVMILFEVPHIRFWFYE